MMGTDQKLGQEKQETRESQSSIDGEGYLKRLCSSVSSSVHLMSVLISKRKSISLYLTL